MAEHAHHRYEAVVATLAAEALRSFGELRSVARGASMIPSIFPEDILIIQRETARRVRRGDVVLFFRDGLFCAHRVVDKAKERGPILLITRGDFLVKNDLPVTENEVVGRVAAVIRCGKRIELDRDPAASERMLRWAVRRSRGVAKWLLRWHSLRLAGFSISGARKVHWQPQESI